MIEVPPELMSQLVADNVVEIQQIVDETDCGDDANSNDSDEFFDADHVHTDVDIDD